jgi:hypothetical protein
MRDGPDSGGRLDRARSRRERMIERETRDANRLLRKVRLLLTCAWGPAIVPPVKAN